MSLTRCSEGRRRRRGRRPRPSSAWPSSSPSPGSASAAARPAIPGTNQMWAYRHVTPTSANHSPPACPGRAAGSWRAPRSRAAARCCCWCDHSDPPRPRARGEPRAARWAWSRVTGHGSRVALPALHHAGSKATLTHPLDDHQVAAALCSACWSQLWCDHWLETISETIWSVHSSCCCCCTTCFLNHDEILAWLLPHSRIERW